MIKSNEYFNGQVKSLALTTKEGPATVGVILKGEYEFGTDSVEVMQVVYGTLWAMLPGKSDWVPYHAGASFSVAKGVRFKVKAEEDTGYLCLYR